jgi:TolB-like protein
MLLHSLAIAPNEMRQTMRTAVNLKVLEMQAPSNPDAPDLEINSSDIPQAMIREQLERILRSPIFVHSSRMCRFLRFVVEASLTEESDSLKEYVIGLEVYDRKPPYHPSQDSIVRTEARRLRTKLKEYYESRGKHDPLFIYFRSGSYLPVYRLQKAGVETNSTDELPGDNESSDSQMLSIALLPFEDASADPISADCARFLNQELTHQLATAGDWQVITPIAPHASPDDLHRINQKEQLVADLILHGTLARDNTLLVITCRLCNAEGTQLCSYRFELTTQRRDISVLKEVASTIISRLRLNEFDGLTAAGVKKRSLCQRVSSLLSAEAQLEEMSSSEVHAAQVRLRELVRTSPLQARSYRRLAECQLDIALSGAPGSRDIVCQAKRSVLRALEVDPNAPSAHSCLAFVMALTGNTDAAVKSFEAAFALGAGAADYRRFSLFLAAQGNFDDAWHMCRKAQALDPFSPRQRLASARILYLGRKYDQLCRSFDGPLVYGPPPMQAQIFYALAALELGQIENARQTAYRLRQESIAAPLLMAPAAEILARCGDASLASRTASHFQLFSSGSPTGKIGQATLALALGDQKLSETAFAAAVEQRDAEIIWASVDPRFDSLGKMAQLVQHDFSLNEMHCPSVDTDSYLRQFNKISNG